MRPETLIRWHRAGWKLFWRLKPRRGRPPIPVELQALIRRIANENPSWGEERIANELLLKIGIRVSPRTVNKYLPRRPRGRPRGDLRWSTFLRLHAQGIIACDFFVAVTATFRLLYMFVVIEHRSRRLVHYNVTAHPSAAFHPEILDRSLQWRAPAYVAGSWHSRSTGHHAGPPEAIFATSTRRIVRRSGHIGPWRAASRIFPGACRRVIELLRTTGVLRASAAMSLCSLHAVLA